MSSIGNSNTLNFTSFDPTQFHGDLDEIRKEASGSILKALTMLGTLDATGVLPGDKNATALEAPKGLMMNAADLTLRIGLLQDALNELMQQVSKTEIQGRLNDLNRENAEQVDKMKKQMEEVEKSVKKQQEAAKKSNIFQAIANFFKAIFDIVCAVFNFIAAAAYALVNPVAAAGLIVAGCALIASGVCNLVLAIDATVAAATGKGFLDDKHKANLAKAAEICGYIALGASMISGVAVITQGLRAGAALAAKQLTQAGLEAGTKAVTQTVMKAGTQAFKELMKMGAEEVTENSIKFAMHAAKAAMKEGATAGVKEAAQQAAQLAVQGVVKDLMKQIFKPLVDMSMKQAIAGVLTQAPAQIVTGAGELKVADLQAEAADARRKADEAEAQAKAIQAMITMLRNLIEQLQSDLEEMMESSMETVSAIFKAADDSAESMKELMNFQSA